MPNVVPIVALALTLAGCATDPLEDAPHATSPSLAPDPPERGASGGKGDAVGSCAERCGGGGPGCWCDAGCVAWGDCCEDFRAACATEASIRLPDALPSDARGVPIFVDLEAADLLDVPLEVSADPPLVLTHTGHRTASPAAAEGDRWRATIPIAWIDVACTADDGECRDRAEIQVRRGDDGRVVAARSVVLTATEGLLSEVPCRDADHMVHEDRGDGDTRVVDPRVEGSWQATVDHTGGFTARIRRAGRSVDRVDLSLRQAPHVGVPHTLDGSERLTGLANDDACTVDQVLIHELAPAPDGSSTLSMSWWGHCITPGVQAASVPAAIPFRGCLRVAGAAPPWLVHVD